MSRLPLLCGYCRNPHLVPPKAETEIAWSEVLSFLESRHGLLDGVVFSGGEPTLQVALPDAIRAVRELGFRIGSHTAGPYPARLTAVPPLVDWIGFDIKAAFDDYVRITGTTASGIKAKASLLRVLQSGVACDFRTTVHDALLNHFDLARLASELAALGVHAHRLQPFRAAGCTNVNLL